MGQGHHHDGHSVNLLSRKSAGLVVHTGSPHPAFKVRRNGGAFDFLASGSDLDLIGVFKIKEQMGCRGLSVISNGLQALQNDLLKEVGQLSVQDPGRRWIHPQSLAQTVFGQWIAKG